MLNTNIPHSHYFRYSTKWANSDGVNEPRSGDAPFANNSIECPPPSTASNTTTRPLSPTPQRGLQRDAASQPGRRPRAGRGTVPRPRLQLPAGCIPKLRRHRQPRPQTRRRKDPGRPSHIRASPAGHPGKQLSRTAPPVTRPPGAPVDVDDKRIGLFPGFGVMRVKDQVHLLHPAIDLVIKRLPGRGED